MLKSGVFHINGYAAYNGSICIPFQFQAYTAAFLGYYYLYDVTTHVFCPSKHAGRFAITL